MLIVYGISQKKNLFIFFSTDKIAIFYLYSYKKSLSVCMSVYLFAMDKKIYHSFGKFLMKLDEGRSKCTLGTDFSSFVN